MKKIFLFCFFICAINYCGISQCSDPYAGEDLVVCGSWANVTVENATTGYWTAYVDGVPLSFPPYYSPNNTSLDVYVSVSYYEGPYYTIDLVWSDDSGPCFDTVSITYAKQTFASVGSINQAEICGNEFVFAADTTAYGWATGIYWTSPFLSAEFNDSLLINATVTIDDGLFGDSAYVTAPFLWNVDNYTCHAVDSVWVTFYQKPEAYAGIDNAFCGISGELGAVFDIPESVDYSPSGWWSASTTPNQYANVSFSAISIDTTMVSVTHTGVYELVFRDNNTLLTSCYSTDTVQIEFVETPYVYAGEDFDVCGTVANLNAMYCDFYCTWEDILFPSNFADPEDPNTQVFSNSYGPVTYVWQGINQATTSFLECVGDDSVIVTFWRAPTPSIVTETNTTVFGLTYDNLLAEYPGIGVTGFWYSESSLIVFGNLFSNETWVEVPYYGSFDFYWYEENGPPFVFDDCSSSAGPVTMHFLDQSSAEIFDLNASVSIFPNPAKDIITIRSDYKISNVNIYDVNGRLVLSLSEMNSNIDVSTLEPGVYFATIITDKGKGRHRFVKL